MRGLKNIVLTLGILVALIGTYAYISLEPKSAGISDTATEKREITNISKDKIVKMILTSNKEELMFEKDDNKWVLNSRENFELDQNVIKNLTSSFALLFAERSLEENPEDLEKYGLKTPAVVAKAIVDDGSEKIYYLGNKTPEGNTYYFMVKGDPSVYTVWMNHGNNFSLKLNDVRLKTLPEIVTKEIKYFYLKQEGKPAIEIVLNEDELGKDYEWGLWLMKQPYKHSYTVDTKAFNKITQELSNLRIKDVIEEDPSDVSKYGLDNPKIEIKLQDNSNTLHLYIGSNKDEDTVYFKTQDKNDIYTMEILAIHPFINIDPFEFIDRFAYIVDINKVNGIKVESRGKEHNITLTRTVKKTEAGTDRIVTIYKIDGKEVGEGVFKSYYQKLIGITFDAEIDEDVENTMKELKTTFFLNTGETVVVEYVPYNKDFYAVFRDGSSEFVVTKKKIVNMINELGELIK